MRFSYFFLFLVIFSLNTYAAESNVDKIIKQIDDLPTASPEKSTVVKRQRQEKQVAVNPFSIVFHRPNYVLPFYYTGSPYQSVYEGNTPSGEKLQNSEVKYQISLKLPVLNNIFSYPINLLFAYTQTSYWQLYNRKAFFRETDYEPELFFSYVLNKVIYKDISLNFINIGFSHQSNGFGNDLERTWNRLYLELIFSRINWMLSIKPWYVIKDSSYQKYNSDLTTYMGYGLVTFAYKFSDQVFSLQLRNLTGGNKITAEFGWTFPFTCHLQLFLQVFSGYGQSLIEYNHRTNSVGIGVAFNNWI